MILLKIFYTFFRIGLFTFGGGYAMLPLVEEAVLSNGWLEESAIIDFIAISESTPGPFAVNMATYVGTSVAGIPGGILATLGVILPSFIIILIISRFYRAFKDSRLISGAMRGLKPATIGLIAAAVINMMRTVFFPNGLAISSVATKEFAISAVIFGVMTVLALKKINPVLIIVISAAAGIACGYIFRIGV